MRYIIFIITMSLLVGCNLSEPDEVTVNPTADTSTLIDEVRQIAYWQSLAINNISPDEDDIVFFEQVVLTRVESDVSRSNIPAIDIETAIQDMINSPNVWTADNLTIESLSINGNQATINLSGNISAVGGAILSIVLIQFQLTIFEEASIDSVLVTLNGNNLANLGIANDSQAVANDVPFTREGLASFLANMP